MKYRFKLTIVSFRRWCSHLRAKAVCRTPAVQKRAASRRPRDNQRWREALRCRPQDSSVSSPPESASGACLLPHPHHLATAGLPGETRGHVISTTERLGRVCCCIPIIWQQLAFLEKQEGMSLALLSVWGVSVAASPSSGNSWPSWRNKRACH